MKITKTSSGQTVLKLTAEDFNHPELPPSLAEDLNKDWRQILETERDHVRSRNAKMNMSLEHIDDYVVERLAGKYALLLQAYQELDAYCKSLVPPQ